MSILKTVTKLATDNGPAILSGLAVVGLGTSVVLAVRATGPALVDIWDGEHLEGRKLTLLEKTKVAWPHYLPTAATVLVTGAAIIVAQSTNSRRQAILAGAVSLSEKAFTDYREKVREVVGEKKTHEVDTRVARDKMDEAKGGHVIITGGGEQLCFDEISGRFFTSDMETIRRAVNDINKVVLNDDYASLNDFYRAIDIPINGFGEEMGWNTDRLMEVNFTSHLEHEGDYAGKTALSIQYNVTPIRGYGRRW